MYIDEPVTVSTAGCFSGILRRIACGTHRDANSREVERAVTGTGPPSPGVVARLMGLDSLPAAGPSDASGTIRRTRSANSADGWNGFLSGHSNWAAKGSRSFREPPTFLREDDADFFVLSFVVADDVGSRKEKCDGEFDEGKNVEKAATTKKGSRCANRKSADYECSSQDSSPVSVLDRRADTDAEYVMGLTSPVSGGEREVKKAKREKLRPKQPSPQEVDKKKKSNKCTSPSSPKAEAKAAADVINSTKETENLRSAAAAAVLAAAISSTAAAAAKCSERRGEGTAPLLLLPRVQRNSCQLAEDDVSRSSWRAPWEFHLIEDVIGAAVEMEIMEFLVHETVTELSFYY